MRRVRKFLVLQVPGGIAKSPPKLPKSLRSETEGQRIQGWHPSWDAAINLLKESPLAEVAIADDDGSGTVIVYFGRWNLEVEQAVMAKTKTKWRSSKISGVGEYWCNLNFSNYAWDWVGGAEREVPFRLEYFERHAEANPDGIVSRARALISELRDVVYGPGKKID